MIAYQPVYLDSPESYIEMWRVKIASRAVLLSILAPAH